MYNILLQMVHSRVSGIARSVFLSALSATLISGFVGCSTLEPQRPLSDVDTMVGAAPEPSRIEQSSPLEESPLFLLGESEAETDEVAAFPKRFSLSARDADLKSTLMAFSKDTNYSMIIDPDVEGQVSVDLKEVDIFRALDSILIPLGYTYTREGNFFHVMKEQLVARGFAFNYITTQRKSERSLSFKNMSVSGGGSSGSGDSSSSGGSDSSDDSETTVEDTVFAGIWQDVQMALATIIFGDSESSGAGADELRGLSRGDEYGRRLLVNPQGGIIYVLAFPREIKQVEAYLEELEEAVRRQVLIEARILEVFLSDEFAYGLNWSYSMNFPNLSDLDGNLLDFTGTFADSTFNQLLAPANGDMQIGLANDHFSLLLNALAREGQVNVLSSPRISTLNNQPAFIRVVREEVFFQADISPTIIVDGTVTGGETEYNPVVFPIGVILEVTPQIGDDNTVSLDIHPTISSIVRVEESPIGDTQPVIDRREIDTVIKVKNGDTFVMAGLIQESHQEDNNAVPAVSKVPIIGDLLFKGLDHKNSKTELVIMMKPTILNDFKITQIHDESIDRIKKLRKKPSTNLNPYVYSSRLRK